MAYPINDQFNKLEGRKAVPCNDSCEYWRFPHLDTACELSSVFSVAKGVLCYEYIAKDNKALQVSETRYDDSR